MDKYHGYTIVEISLFLAITALLFVGIIAGTGNSIAQQRFYDSTQNFAEFLRSIYSQVANPQSLGTGQSSMAIYGKRIVFPTMANLNAEQVIEIYDVRASANVQDIDRLIDNLNNGSGGARYILNATYIPRWGAGIEDRWGNPFTGEILVIRHPQSGTINTMYRSTQPGARFGVWPLDFCINPSGLGVQSSTRYDVRLAENARNASGVEVINLDSGTNDCK